MKKFLLLSMVAFVLVGCTIKNPSGTHWDIDLNLPLMDEIYPMSDLIDDEFIFMDSDSTLYAKSVGDINTTPIEELVVELDASFPIPHLYSNLTEYPGAVPFESILPDYKIEVVFGKIKSGYLYIDYVDIVQEEHKAVVELVFDEIVNEEGLKFSPMVDLTEAGTFSEEFDLSGYFIKTTGDITDEDVAVNELKFTVSLTDIGSSPAGTDFGSMEVILANQFNFESFYGSIDGFSMDVEKNIADLDIEYPENTNDVIAIEDVKVILDLVSDIGFGSRFDGFITAHNDDGDSVRVEIRDDEGNFFSIPSAPVGFDEYGYPMTIASPSQFISDGVVDSLFTIMPTSLTIHSSKIYIDNPTTGYGFIPLIHDLHGEYTGIIPFTFSILNPTIPLINSENSVSHVSQENQDIINKHVQEAEIELHVDNNLPLSAWLSIYIHNEPLGSTADSLDLAVLKIEGDDLDDNGEPDGFYVEKFAQDKVFNIHVADFSVFENDSVYIKFKLLAEGTDEPVTLTATHNDFIRLNGALKLKARLE